MVNNTGINKPEWNPKDNTENVQGITKEGVKVCTGCGHVLTDAIQPPYLSCCPDSNYLPIREFIEEWRTEIESAKKKVVALSSQSQTEQKLTLAEFLKSNPEALADLKNVYEYGQSDCGEFGNVIGLEPYLKEKFGLTIN